MHDSRLDMDMRDEFAGRALIGVLSGRDSWVMSASDKEERYLRAATEAYRYATAMIVARGQVDGP